MNSSSINILFFIRSLSYGGAQRQLTVLCKVLHQRQVQLVVVTFYPSNGEMEKELRAVGVRSAAMDMSLYDQTTQVVYRIQRWASQFADMIITNSHSARDHACALGFPKEKIVVVPNGIDTNRMAAVYNGCDIVTSATGGICWRNISLANITTPRSSSMSG